MLGTDIFSDFAINQSRHRANDAESALDQMRVIAQQYADLYGEMILANVENLGVRYALAEQLEKADPSNPLLSDAMLLEQLKAAVSAAFELAERDWDAAREAGRIFKIPARKTPSTPPPKVLKHEHEQIKLAYAGVIALRCALSEQLKRFDPENPLLTDYAVQERIHSGGITAYKNNGDNFDAAREVGRTFVVPNHD